MKVNKQKHDVIKDAINQHSPVFFSASNVNITFESRIKKVLPIDALVIVNTVAPNYITPVVNSQKFFLQVNMFRFESDEIKSDGKYIVFPLKYDDAIENSRTTERYSFSTEEKVVCEILNPLDRQTLLKKRVMDMSSTGLCISTHIDSALFQPGMYFEELKVTIERDSFFKSSGTVVYVRKYINIEGKIHNQVGIKFTSEVPSIFG